MPRISQAVCVQLRGWDVNSLVCAPTMRDKRGGGLSLIGKAVEVKNTVMVSMTSCGLH